MVTLGVGLPKAVHSGASFVKCPCYLLTVHYSVKGRNNFLLSSHCHWVRVVTPFCRQSLIERPKSSMITMTLAFLVQPLRSLCSFFSFYSQILDQVPSARYFPGPWFLFFYRSKSSVTFSAKISVFSYFLMFLMF